MGVVSLGELLIDFVALESGVSVGDASGFEKKPGGAPANVAVAVQRLGVPCYFMGQVGDDPFGHYLAGVIQAEGVDVTALTFSDVARTALAFVSLGANGERSFQFYRHPSADMLMTTDDLRLEVLDHAQIFHFGSITMITDPSKTATLTAARTALERGLKVSYDPNLRLALWEDADAARAGMMLGMDYAHVVKVSDEELAFLTEGDLAPLWREHTEVILVTAGEQGATAHLRNGLSVAVKGYSVQPVDTTGAGDAFVAGFLVGMLEHPDYQNADTLQQMLRFANAAGAITTTGRGAIPSLPTRAQVLALMAQ